MAYRRGRYGPPLRRIKWGRVAVFGLISGLILVSAYGITSRLLQLCARQLWGEGVFFRPGISAEIREPIRQLAQTKQWEKIFLPKSAIHGGDLILVNGNLAYHDPKEEVPTVYQAKTGAYQIQNHQIRLQQQAIQALNQMMDDFYAKSGLTDVLLVSGWRSVDHQKLLYHQDLVQMGRDYSTRVAKPGFSEHHTGLALDLGLSGWGRVYDGTGNYAWINENCADYGFIIRYQEEKMELTQTQDEPWHLRYVGVPHAQVMAERDLCLEEYHGLLKSYSFDVPHLMAEDREGNRYEIYYQQPEPGEEELIGVWVPRDQRYTLSGDNDAGIIVTIQLPKEAGQ